MHKHKRVISSSGSRSSNSGGAGAPVRVTESEPLLYTPHAPSSSASSGTVPSAPVISSSSSSSSFIGGGPGSGGGGGGTSGGSGSVIVNASVKLRSSADALSFDTRELAQQLTLVSECAFCVYFVSLMHIVACECICMCVNTCYLRASVRA